MEVRLSLNKGCMVGVVRKGVMKCRTLGLEAKSGLHDAVVVPTVLYRDETWGMRATEKGRVREMAVRVDMRVLMGFGHMETRGKYRLVMRVVNAYQGVG